MTKEQLITALEQADGPSRELDRTIGEAVGADMAWSGDIVGLGYAPYTASVDAALTLVPPDYEWFGDYVDGRAVWSVAHRAGSTDPICGRHVKPAIAICIACLKAQ